MIFRKWGGGGGGSKAVWNFSESLSDIAQLPFPKELIDAAKTEIGSLTKIESLQVISGHSADFYPFEEASYFLQTEDKKHQQQIVLDWILSASAIFAHKFPKKGIVELCNQLGLWDFNLKITVHKTQRRLI